MVPKVAIVIPHVKGEEILRRCLLSLKKTTYTDYEIVIIDNGSTDGSVDRIQNEFPEVCVLRSPINLGFAGGCNLGIRSTQSPYVVLLNNDTEVTENWLGPLIEEMDKDPSVAAVQPKLLSLENRERFDYCGAAGGEIDLFGYPFAWGRLFDSIEIDEGQYDDRKQVFWATGAATVLRRSALDSVGLMDETFFAHMEEIDLNWRLQWAGYRVVVVPSALIYHHTGATLGTEQLRKMVLNHRNSLLMILKNYTESTLFWLLPLRVLLELVALVASLCMGKPKRALAVLGGFFGVISLWRSVINGRRLVKSIRSVSEEVLLHRMYRGSIALAYFLRGVRKVKDL